MAKIVNYYEDFGTVVTGGFVAIDKEAFQNVEVENYTKNVTIETYKGFDTITNNGENVLINSDDGDDIIVGYGPEDTIPILDGGYTTVKSSSDVIITVGAGSITLKDAENRTLNIVGGITTQTTLTLTNADKKTIKAGESVQTIDARARTKATNITANSLGDTIYSGKGADKFYLDSGEDVVIYSSGDGKDIIYNYEEEDKIVIESGEISSIKPSGSNILIYVGKGRLTVKNAKGKKITLTDASGTTTSQTYDNGVMYFSDAAASTGKANSGIYTLDASNRTKGIKLTGNAKANTLIGGSGDDVLKGGSGADTFIYSAGNDTITDYTAKDNLIFHTTINSVTVDKNNVIFNTDNGTLTLRNGKGKNITLTEASGQTSTQTFNVSSYETLEPWFSEDDNLITADSNDVAIPSGAEIYSAGKVESFNLTDLNANDLTKISYAKKDDD